MNPIQISIIGDKRLLKDGELIKHNGTLFNVYKYEPNQEVEQFNLGEQLARMTKEYNDKKRQEQLELIQYATGSDTGTCERILQQYEKKKR